MRLTWISRGWENVERHWSKDVAPMDGAYFSRNFSARKCGCRSAPVMSSARPSASTMSCPPSAESSARLTAGDSRTSRTFAVLGMLKISTIGSCHANPDGNVARAPVGADRAEPDDRLRRQPLGGMTIVRPRHVQERHRLTLASAGLLAGLTAHAC